MLMTREQFESYEAEFNGSADKSAFFDRWYRSDAVFVHPLKGTFRGKAQVVGFWNSGQNSGHQGIHEILQLKDFIAVEGRFAVQLAIEWRCFEDTNYLGPRKKGDVFGGKCAAFYTLDGNKIAHVDVYLNLNEPA
jgi:hypothetical protein